MAKDDLQRALQEADIMARYHRESIAKYDAIKAMVAEEWDRVTHGHRVAVTDHAIVRFIERFGGADIEEVRKGIMALIAAGRPEVVVSNRTVITVLPEGIAGDGRNSHRPDVESSRAALFEEARELAAKQASNGPV
jgi:hypothetical protein